MSDMPNQLPTEEDLKKLSWRGMVCYAVRCAMRVVHLTEPDPELHEKSKTCIKVATRFCLASSANAGVATYAAYAAASDTADANASAHAATAAARAAARAAANAAHTAARGTADAADAAKAAAKAYATTAAYAVAKISYFADPNAASVADAAYAAANADFNRLLELTGHQIGKLGDPINPGENGCLGPLWPDENQELLKAIEESDPETLFTIYFDETSGVTPENELLFLKYLHTLYQEQGGIGLKIISDKQFQYKEEKINVY